MNIIQLLGHVDSVCVACFFKKFIEMLPVLVIHINKNLQYPILIC